MNKLYSLLMSLCLFPFFTTAQSVIRGPYLQNGGTGHITIKWRTDQPTQSKVNFGENPNSLSINSFIGGVRTDHEVKILNLLPNTTYYYNIANASQILVPGGPDMYFKTAPSVGSTDAYKFWFLGDCGTANDDARQVRNAYYNYIGDQHTDGIIFLGDNAYAEGTDSEYQLALFENMYEDKLKNSIAWATLGNHDGMSASSESQTGPYYDIFSLPIDGESGGLASGTEAYYSFDYGNIHFICLDSYETDRAEGATMYNWCEMDIQNTNQEWIVAYWHHPPYSKGSHDSDGEEELKEMRTNFLPMLEDNGVDLVLSGHSHSYERTFFINGHYGKSATFNETHLVGNNGGGDGRLNGSGAYLKDINGYNAGDGAVYITAGSSGKVTEAPLDHQAMFYSVAALGSCLLEVENEQLQLKFIQDNGAVSDYFSIHKNKVPCAIGTPCNDQDLCTINDVWNSDCNCEGTSKIDSDNDGLCDDEDCAIYNPLFPAEPGSSCDDGNASTPIDVVLADGCSCGGFYEAPCIAEIFVENNIITIGGLTDDANAKIFDENWNPIWGCDPWTGLTCNTTESYVAENGVYNISITSSLCDFFEQITINFDPTGCPDNDNDGICQDVDCDDNNPSIPTTPNSPCNDGNSSTENDVIQADGCTCLGVPMSECNVSTTSNDGVISILGAAGTNTKIFSSEWNVLWECNTWTGNPCSNLETFQSGAGLFYITAQSDNCDFLTEIEVSDEECEDSDTDGICNDEDCEPFNPALPTTPNSPCNDGNSETDNDVIQSDGCTCLGTLINSQNECNINYTIGQNSIEFAGLSDDIVTLALYDSNINAAFECGTWTTPCNTIESVTNLFAGTYYLYYESFDADWNQICSEGTTITMGINLASTDVPVKDTKKLNDFKLYPNPTKEFINLDLTHLDYQNISIEIYDLVGQKIRHNNINSSSVDAIVELSLLNFKNGIYNLALHVDGQYYKSRTFVVMN